MTQQFEIEADLILAMYKFEPIIDKNESMIKKQKREHFKRNSEAMIESIDETERMKLMKEQREAKRQESINEVLANNFW